MENFPCPQCKGTGELVCTVHADGKVSQIALTCITCNGAKTVSAKQKKSYQDMLAMWCSCGNPSGRSTFYDDGAHAECFKHHYRCEDCGKVTQTG